MQGPGGISAFSYFMGVKNCDFFVLLILTKNLTAQNMLIVLLNPTIKPPPVQEYSGGECDIAPSC